VPGSGNETRRRPVTKSDYEAAVAAFMRSKGVTRCPTACLSATQASVSAVDRERLQKQAAELETRRLERQTEHCRRLFGACAAEARAL
jgi:hypothetical protein